MVESRKVGTCGLTWRTDWKELNFKLCSFILPTGTFLGKKKRTTSPLLEDGREVRSGPRNLVSPATVPSQPTTPLHVLSSDAARIIFSDTKGSFVCSYTITRLFLPHPSPACARARVHPNECAFETADSQYSVRRDPSQCRRSHFECWFHCFT